MNLLLERNYLLLFKIGSSWIFLNLITKNTAEQQNERLYNFKIQSVLAHSEDILQLFETIL